MRKRITWMAVVVALFIFLGGLSFAVEMYFDYMWYLELGKAVVFTTAIYAKSLLCSGILLVSFLFLYFNLLFANRGPGLISIGIPTPTGQITAYTVSSEVVRRVGGLLSALIGLFIGLSGANDWETVWRWLHRVDFNTKDPVFLKDVSFYFFSLPIMRELVRLGLVLGFIALVGVLVLYYFKGVLSWRKPRRSACVTSGGSDFSAACRQRIPGSL